MDITVGQIKALLERLQRGKGAVSDKEEELILEEIQASKHKRPATGAALGVGDEFQEFLGDPGAAPDGALVPGDNQVPILRAPEGPNKRPPTEDELMADRRREMIRAMRGMGMGPGPADFATRGRMRPPSRNMIGAPRRQSR